MKGILFNPDMIKAIAEGIKTQTRRTSGLREINKEPDKWSLTYFGAPMDDGSWRFAHQSPDFYVVYIKPHYHAGETVYVKEEFYSYGYWMQTGILDSGRPQMDFVPNYSQGVYFIENPPEKIISGRPLNKSGWYKRSAMFLPAKYARNFILITDIRPERLKDITPEDCIREGLSSRLREHDACVDLKQKYFELWDRINPGYPSSMNPWLWRYVFKLVTLGG